MGGNAFKQIITGGIFPRMPPQVYENCKATVCSQLKTLYCLVGTPTEAPEKPDHGDVDFVVQGPLLQTEIALKTVAQIIGAVAVVPMEGNNTSNYAVPGQNNNEFHQIDVHVCLDKNEWEHFMFYNSYGDMGMILSLLAGSRGLSLGRKGLKIPLYEDAPHQQPFFLSSNFENILCFFTLSMNTWKAGFKTQVEIFNWLSTSRFYDPCLILKSKPRKGATDRNMFLAFVEYVSVQAASQIRENQNSSAISHTSHSFEDLLEEAKVYFDKKEDYDIMVHGISRKNALKSKFNGNLVIDWTGLYGLKVRKIMEGVRARLTDEEIVSCSADLLKATTLEVQRELGFVTSTS